MKLGKREICIYAGVGVVCILMVWLMGRFIFGFWGGEISEPEGDEEISLVSGEEIPGQARNDGKRQLTFANCLFAELCNY